MAAVLVLYAAALGHQYLRLRSEVAQLRKDSVAVAHGVSGRPTRMALDRAVALIQRDTGRMRRTTSTALWRAAGRTPGLSGTARSATSLAVTADAISHGVVPVLEDVALGALAGRQGPLDLSAVSAQQTRLSRAAVLLAGARASLDALDLRDPAVRAGHREMRLRVDQLNRAVSGLVTIARLAPAMTGEHGARHYLVVLQSPAESRAAGGLVGGFLELSVVRGQVTLIRSGTNHALSAGRRPVPADAGYAKLWGAVGGQQQWYASNLSLHFPSTARVWAGLYAQQYGVTVDGVLGVTPEALSGLLQVVGPLRLPGGGVIQAPDVPAALEVALYADFPRASDEAGRNAFQLEVLAGLSRLLLTSRAFTLQGVLTLSNATETGALRLASSHPGEEALLQSTAIGGSLPSDDRPFVAWSTQNAAGNKVDVYLQRELSFTRAPTTAGRELGTATLTLTNLAPASGLPPYVTERHDAAARTAPVGSDKLAVATYLTRGAVVRSVTVDGRPATFATGVEQDHPVVVLSVELDPGHRTTVQVVADEPVGRGPVSTVRQVLFRPDVISLR